MVPMSAATAVSAPIAPERTRDLRCMMGAAEIEGVVRLRISMTVNGGTQEHDVEPRLLLVHYLREVVGLTGTNVGCDTTSCGACTVLFDGESANSCTILAVHADGADITTVE